jgi:hypothetical protein
VFCKRPFFPRSEHTDLGHPDSIHLNATKTRIITQ